MVRLLSLVAVALAVLLTCAAGCSTSEPPGSWAVTNPPACPVPAMVQPNGSCSTPPGTSCKSDVPRLDCNGQMVGFVGCTCAASKWMCGVPFVPGCPDGGDDATTGEAGQGAEVGTDDASDATEDSSGCPPETLVESGAACAVPQTLTCKSAAHTFDCDAQVDGYVSCNCVSGAWLCGPSSTCTDGGADAATDAGLD